MRQWFIAVAACAALLIGARAEAQGTGPGAKEEGQSLSTPQSSGSPGDRSGDTGSSDPRAGPPSGQAHGAGTPSGQQAPEQQQKQAGQQEPQQQQAQQQPQQQQPEQRQQPEQQQAGQPPQQQAGQQAGQQAQAGQQGELKSVVGSVEGVEQDTLAIKNRLGETHQFKIGEDTKFTRDGREISRDEISEGDQVRAAFRGQGDPLNATEIKVLGGGQGQGAEHKGSQAQEQPAPQPGSAGDQGQGTSGPGSTGAPTPGSGGQQR